MNNWEKLCQAIKNYTIHNDNPFKNEKCFENHFSEYLRYIFDWNFDEIKNQEIIKFGHEEKRADITIHYDNKAAIVVELKAFGQPLAGEEIAQLSSYMKQLQTRFGILTNSISLQLYYRPKRKDGDRDEPQKVLSIRYNENDQNGQILGELLTKNNFSLDKMEDFCKELINNKNKEDLYKYKDDDAFPMMSEQMTKDLDNKIINMIPVYLSWLDKNKKEKEYVENYRNGIEWINNNVFTIPNLRKFSDKDYEDLIHQIPQQLINLKFGATRTLYTGLSGSRKTFVEAIKYINASSDTDKFKILHSLLDSQKYKIKGMGRSFWSEIIRCKYEDVPLINSKTVDFFTAIDLFIGLTADEQTKNISYCYNRWAALYKEINKKEIDLFRLSHMEHFAKESDEGRKFMKDNFNSVVGDYTN